MELGIVGLGKMGIRIARRLNASGIRVVGYDTDHDTSSQAEKGGVERASSLADMVVRIEAPRIVWLMLPAGDAVESAISELLGLLDAGDLVVDGGNSNYRDTLRRAAQLENEQLHFVDVGTSGGVFGEEDGFCLTVGGSEEDVDRLRPLLVSLAPAADRGWGHVGPAGAGHFVKMVHNGIEYGVMQAYAEGLAILDAKPDFDLDLAQVTEIWRSGSIVRSWLLDLISAQLRESTNLSDIEPYVEDSGEGRWTIQEAIDLNVAAPVITASLLQRLRL